MSFISYLRVPRRPVWPVCVFVPGQVSGGPRGEYGTCVGSSCIDKLLLTSNPRDYAFLNTSQLDIEGVDDLVEWRVLKVCHHHA